MSDVLLKLEGVGRDFDVSRPWLNRVIERDVKQYFKAVDGVTLSIRRGETFALVTRAMEEAGSYENWGRKSYRTAIEALLHKGYLIDTGKFFGRAKQYTLPLKRRR